jgi:hypothetical protein
MGQGDMNCVCVRTLIEHGACNASAEIVRGGIRALYVARQPEREACAVGKTVADCRVSYFLSFSFLCAEPAAVPDRRPLPPAGSGHDAAAAGHGRHGHGPPVVRPSAADDAAPPAADAGRRSLPPAGPADDGPAAAVPLNAQIVFMSSFYPSHDEHDRLLYL